MEVIKPIHQDLTNKTLLKKVCWRLHTEQQRELQPVSMKISAQKSFRGLAVLEIGVKIALICFNDCKNAILKLMSRFDVKPDAAAIKWAKTADEEFFMLKEEQHQQHMRFVNLEER